MKVVKSDLAEIKLRTLHEANRRVVWSWFKYLGDWETDECVRDTSRLLPGYQDVYILEPTTGPCIFFQLGDGVITILDIAHRDTIRMFAPVASRDGA